MKKNIFQINFVFFILLAVISACTPSKSIEPQPSLVDYLMHGIYPTEQGMLNFTSHYSVIYTKEEFRALPSTTDFYNTKPLYKENNISKWELYDKNIRVFIEEHKETKEAHENEQSLSMAMLQLVLKQSNRDILPCLSYYVDILHECYCDDAPRIFAGLKRLKKERYWSQDKINTVASRAKLRAKKRLEAVESIYKENLEELGERNNLEWYEERKLEMLQEWIAYLKGGIKDLSNL